MNELLAKLKKLPFLQYKWVQFLVYLVKNFIDDNCTQKASALTYTTLLSIVPILTLVVVILSSVPELAKFKEQIQALIFSNLLPSTGSQVSKYINQFASNSSNLTLIGVGILFFTTISTLVTIETAFNQIWRVDKKESSWLNLLRYWAIITLAPLMLGTAFIISSTVQSLSFLNQKIGGYGIDWAIWVQIASIGVMMMGLVAMYWFIPRCQVRFKHALIAGVTVGIIFELLKLSFGLIVDNFTSYKAVYGAFAILPLFLLWVYISWNVILLGVQISYCLTIFETKEVHPRHALFSLMDMLNVMYREHKKGNAVTEAGLRDVLGRQEMPNWYTYISFLQDNNLIATSEKDEYVLKRSLNDYSFWDFYKNLPYPLPHEKDLRKLKNHAPWTADWITTLANGEAMLKHNFDIPMSNIFDQIAPRQTPNPQDIEPNTGKIGKGNQLASSREKSGLSGGQVSDVVNEDKRIKETDVEQATGFDGTLDFKGHGGNAQPMAGSDFNQIGSHNHQQNQLQNNQQNLNQNNRQNSGQTIHAYHRSNLGKLTATGVDIDDSLNNDSFDNELKNEHLVQVKNANFDKVEHGDNTGTMAKIRQIVPEAVLNSRFNPFNIIKNKINHRLGNKDPRIITDKDKT
ncbi:MULTISPECIES: YhjD/YihY/BrkB family envelope integrity protein [unclassified Moraxella]|uniref:YhjD/YihY/BrkB family envelope integrity protein n=1 Tax=unclassified Moraxella TaxID=2685852 RepID=UPI003AF5057B